MPHSSMVTQKIAQWIDEILDKTNQGFVNSRIPLVLTKFCQEKATINDQQKPVLSSFRRMKGSIEALRNTSDLAALLVDSFDVCGIADFPGSLSDSFSAISAYFQIMRREFCVFCVEPLQPTQGSWLVPLEPPKSPKRGPF